MKQDGLRRLWEQYELTGDTQPLAAFVEAHMSSLVPCQHKYPHKHRICEVRLRGKMYCVMRCIECDEGLFFEPTNLTHDVPGVPYWLQGEMLAQWVADEAQSPAKEAIDRETYRI